MEGLRTGQSRVAGHGRKGIPVDESNSLQPKSNLTSHFLLRSMPVGVDASQASGLRTASRPRSRTRE